MAPTELTLSAAGSPFAIERACVLLLDKGRNELSIVKQESSMQTQREYWIIYTK